MLIFDVVLIVEDDDTNYLFLETALSKEKIKLLRASNGLQAVEMCREFPEIRMVLMDIKMPIMNGYEATVRIKQYRPDLPVIAQTAYAMNEDRKKASTAGFDEYLAKPIRVAELIKLVRKYTNMQRS